MGLGDKFKQLAKQAQETVADHREQIHSAVETVSVAADRKTKGKYTDKIAKFGQKAGDAVDKIGGQPAEEGGEAEAPGTPATAGEAQAPGTTATAGETTAPGTTAAADATAPPPGSGL